MAEPLTPEEIDDFIVEVRRSQRDGTGTPYPFAFVVRVALALDSLDAARAAAPALDEERLATIVSDSLAACTEGSDWAEAPEPSDEPGSPYVLRLTNEIAARLRGDSE